MQKTAIQNTDMSVIAKACGYSIYEKANSVEEIQNAWNKIRQRQGPAFLEIFIKIGSRKDLGRPTNSPINNKQTFMAWLEN
jgi:phosphonopyruvate decarboxylase